MNRRRVAFHEAGHLVMAFLLHMEVLSCRLGPSQEEQGERGRCVVVTPDPVGVRRFLLSMAGVMAEDRFFHDEEGGIRDRHDAADALENYLGHYRRRDRDEAESVLRLASAFFHSPPALRVLRRAASILVQARTLDGNRLDSLRQELLEACDSKPLIEAVDGPAEPEPPLPMAEILLRGARFANRLLLSLRKPFDDPS